MTGSMSGGIPYPLLVSQVRSAPAFVEDSVTVSYGPFGNCTPGEEAHGCYGIMDDARVGGRLQNDMFAFGGDPAANNSVDYNDILYTINQPPDCPVPTGNASWGKVKASYR